MKRSLTVLFAAAFALPALAALKTGDAAPDFKTQASMAGKAFEYSLKQSLANGPVVVYFFPSAYTGGCNAQAHAFATNIDKFKSAGASVVGVSMDSIKRLNDFSADPEYCAGKLPVASDADGKISKSYDLSVRTHTEGMKDSRGVVIDHDMIERTTFIVTKDGKVSSTIGGVTPTANVDAALAAVQQLASAK
jgi:peroxiredoxin